MRASNTVPLKVDLFSAQTYIFNTSATSRAVDQRSRGRAIFGYF